MNLPQLAAETTAAWRNHYDAMRSGAVSLAYAYEAQAEKLADQRREVVSQHRATLTEARAVRLDGNRLDFAASDSQIKGWARRAAREGGALIDRCSDLLEAVAAGRNHCHRYGVSFPELPDDWADQTKARTHTLPALRRVADSKWWRRQGRVMVKRRVAQNAIDLGRVHRKGELYCADESLTRWRERRSENAELLASLVATNELGDEYTLEELAALSVSNPELCRAELMTRIHGLEAIGDQRKDAALFVTVTLPSRFHAVSSKTNRFNPTYDGSSPRDGQAWHCTGWRRVRAALAKVGIALYGFRCVEPHHDGTPHWHMLLWAKLKDMPAVRRAFRKQWLREGENEPGAQRHRVTFKAVSKVKGGATGYIAKYLAKNIDGHQLEATMERSQDGSLAFNSDAPATAAERIRCWASDAGIRQFQFFGTPPITWWRELRRLQGEHDAPVIEAARAPADAGEYQQHVTAAGGVLTHKDDRPLKTWRELLVSDDGAIAVTRYGEVAKPAIRGVLAADGSARALSRLHTWTVESAEAGSSGPWTRVDNCNRADGADPEFVAPELQKAARKSPGQSNQRPAGPTTQDFPTAAPPER